MKMMHLIHPALGTVAMAVITPAKKEEHILHEWKYKYGKNFYRCSTSLIDDKIGLNEKRAY